MVAIAYLLPAIACLLLHFGFRYGGDWTAYAWIFGCGEATVGLCHWAFMRSFTSCEEYLGSTVSSIHYEAPWTEVVVRYETRTDSKGRTYTVARRTYVYHPEKHYFRTTLGSSITTGRAYFARVRDTWGVAPRHDTWAGPHIRGGVRVGHHYNFADLPPACITDIRYWIPVTEAHRYTNKIRCSNSIFKFEKIEPAEAREHGLVDYPPIRDYDAPCILSAEVPVPPFADDMFRRFNGGVAPRSQMRLYIILFGPERSVGVSELQRAYWQGGNKNEMVVCIGTDASGADVRWARAFSWADEQQLETDLSQWLMKGSKLDWIALYGWLDTNIVRWKRKEFKDFDYIHVSLPLKHFLWILAISVAENALALWLTLHLWHQ